MKLSIITVTFNNYEELIRTFESIKSLKGEMEWVVVNGGDCEKTREFLQEKPIENFSFVTEKDEGIADAFNKGAKLSEGENLLFLNSGDLLFNTDYIRWAIEKLNEDRSLAFTHGDILFTDCEFGQLRMRPHGESVGRGMPYYHQTMVINKACFEKAGGFDKSFKIAMDYELVCRMEKAEMKGLYYEGEPVCLMDGSGVSRTQEGKSLKEAKRALKQNGLFWTPSVFFAFQKRVIFYSLRRLMDLLGLKDHLKRLKQKKYS